MYTEDSYEQDEAVGVEVTADIEMASRMREELAKCEHVAKDFAEQQERARSRRESAERCATALRKALGVLEPQEKQMTATSDSIASKIDPSAYRNG